jgi:hypothetical protein
VSQCPLLALLDRTEESCLSRYLDKVPQSASSMSRIKGSVQDFIQHNRLGNMRVDGGIDFFSSSGMHADIIRSVQNAVVESTSIVGTIEAMNLRNTTR